jgi:hypothetical protein
VNSVLYQRCDKTVTAILLMQYPVPTVTFQWPGIIMALALRSESLRLACSVTGSVGDRDAAGSVAAAVAGRRSYHASEPIRSQS